MHCERVRRARPLLGTLVEISLSGNDTNALHESANAAFEAIASVHEIMSFHLPDSDVSRVNNSAVGRAVQIDPRTWRVIELANEISLASGGVFDITVGGEMMARGNLPGKLRRQPDRDASYRDIELLADSHVRIRRPLVIDVGGIAKGYAVDCAVGVLREMAVSSGCVNAGGDLRAFGEETVPVEVRDPLKPHVAGARVSVRDGAFATSANYTTASSFSSSGVVLDPRDDAQVVGGRSASVRATSCVIADALAKCVLILGQGSGSLLRHYDADGFMLGQGGSVLIDTHSHEVRSRGANASVPDAVRPKPGLSKSIGMDSVDANFAGVAL
jgi:thiamine biosynthesis lipoprotein